MHEPESIKLAKQILDDVNRVVFASDFKHYSLMGGLGGVALVNGHYGLITNDNTYIDRCSELLDHCIEISSENPQLSFSDGLTGLAWVITYLVNAKALDYSALEITKELHDPIIESIEYDRSIGNYDLFSGLIGKGVFFLELHQFDNETSFKGIRKIVQALEAISLEDSSGIYWNDVISKRSSSNDIIQNFGMAHGIPGIISFLTDVYRLGIEVASCQKLIYSSISWLLRRSINKPFGYFPQALVDGRVLSEESRLAWCFGDIGIAFTLFKASNIFNVERWRTEAISIMENISQRTLEDSGIWQDRSSVPEKIDPAFCHGVSGIYYQLRKISHYYHDYAILKACDSWKTLLLKYRNQTSSSISGFLTPEVDDVSGVISWIKNPYLLTGVCGISLVLLENDQGNQWDKIFLLSN